MAKSKSSVLGSTAEPFAPKHCTLVGACALPCNVPHSMLNAQCFECWKSAAQSFAKYFCYPHTSPNSETKPSIIASVDQTWFSSGKKPIPAHTLFRNKFGVLFASPPPPPPTTTKVKMQLLKNGSPQFCKFQVSVHVIVIIIMSNNCTSCCVCAIL